MNLKKSRLTAVTIQKHRDATRSQIERAKELLDVLNESRDESELRVAHFALEKISLDLIKIECDHNDWRTK